MWVIIERNKEQSQHCWISGVYKNHQDAQDYLSIDLHEMFDSVPTQELREVPSKDYPVIVVEDFVKRDFFYMTPDELAEKLFNDAKTEDDDHQYCMYFIFRKDFRTTTPGQDELGRTDHHHVDNNQIKYLIKKGLFLQSLGHLNGFYECRNCKTLSDGILSESGYQPPSGWHIILNAPLEEAEEKNETSSTSRSPAYHTYCSDCMNEINLIARAERFLTERLPKNSFDKDGWIGERKGRRVEVIFSVHEALDSNVVIDPPDIRVWVDESSGETELIPQM